MEGYSRRSKAETAGNRFEASTEKQLIPLTSRVILAMRDFNNAELAGNNEELHATSHPLPATIYEEESHTRIRPRRRSKGGHKYVRVSEIEEVVKNYLIKNSVVSAVDRNKDLPGCEGNPGANKYETFVESMTKAMLDNEDLVLQKFLLLTERIEMLERHIKQIFKLPKKTKKKRVEAVPWETEESLARLEALRGKSHFKKVTQSPNYYVSNYHGKRRVQLKPERYIVVSPISERERVKRKAAGDVAPERVRSKANFDAIASAFAKKAARSKRKAAAQNKKPQLDSLFRLKDGTPQCNNDSIKRKYTFYPDYSNPMQETQSLTDTSSEASETVDEALNLVPRPKIPPPTSRQIYYELRQNAINKLAFKKSEYSMRLNDRNGVFRL